MNTLASMNEFHDYFKYNPETGDIIWIKKSSRGTVVGSVAGTLHHDGYIQIRFKGKLYGAHRLAWFLYYGQWIDLVDHENGIGSDNRITNLRAATKRQNAQNSRSKSKHKGVTWAATSQKWRARIVVDGKEHHLGVFESPDDAHAAYVTAAKLYFGEFANDGVVRGCGNDDLQQRKCL